MADTLAFERRVQGPFGRFYQGLMSPAKVRCQRRLEVPSNPDLLEPFLGRWIRM